MKYLAIDPNNVYTQQVFESDTTDLDDLKVEAFQHLTGAPPSDVDERVRNEILDTLEIYQYVGPLT